MKAVYLLFLRLESRETVEVGALGEHRFEPGIYVYAGSAMKSAEKRLERHFSSDRNDHWHIDYLSREAEPFDYFLLPEISEFECVMASILSGFCEEVPGFGCSDCGCSSHLYRIPRNFSG